MGGVVIEAGVIAGYVVAWAVRKARRIGGRLDAEVDTVLDVGLDRLHDVVAVKLDGYPVLAELEEEADSGEVSELTRQQIELALTSAAGRDDAFGQVVTELAAQIREAERAAGTTVITGPIFTGDARAVARDGAVAFGQVAGDVHLNQARDQLDPPQPGRPSR